MSTKTANQSAEKKMGLFSATTMAIGSIIGAGIFGSIPAAAAMVGTGIEWAFLIAMLAIFARYLPVIVNNSVLPAQNGSYVHVTRLVHPRVGFLMGTWSFINIFLLAALARVFGDYASLYIHVTPWVLGVIALILFAIITCMGVAVAATAQNVMVVMLLAALSLFVIRGFPNVKPEFVTLGSVLSPTGVRFVNLGAAVGLLNGTLLGGHVCVACADKIKNPGRDVPLSFIISTILCCLFFMCIAFVSIGIVPIDKLTSLRDIAQIFLPPAMLGFFVIGGAIFAVLTTINGLFLSGASMMNMVAKDYVLPQWFQKYNRHNVAQNPVILLGTGACIVVATGWPVGILLSMYSFLSLFIGLVLFFPAMRVHTLYPNLYKNAYMKLTPVLIKVISTLGIAVSLWQLYSFVRTMKPPVLITLIAWLVGWFVYYFVRRQYLKGKGIDMEAVMRAPYPGWEDKEKALAATLGEYRAAPAV